MKRQKRNNVFIGGSKFDLNYPGFFKISLEHHYLTWFGITTNVELKDNGSELCIRIHRTHNPNYYTEQKSRTMTGDKLNDSMFCLDKFIVLGVEHPVDLNKYTPYYISYYSMDDIIDEYKMLCRKNNCSVPSDIELSDCNEYVEITLKW